MVNSIIILAIVILPGWISITANRRYYPRISDESNLMTWGMLFYHAAIVHAIGIAVTALVTLSLQEYFLNTLDIDRLLPKSPAEFTREMPITALVLFASYGIWMIVGSALSGIIDLPSRLTDGIGKVMNKIKLAPAPMGDEPVWYNALNLDRKIGEKELNILVSVRMKNGNVYVGDLESYPILPDSEASKDIRLGKSVLYLDGDISSPIELEFSNYGGGGVLLNTLNVSSIEYILHDNYQSQGNDETA